MESLRHWARKHASEAVLVTAEALQGTMYAPQSAVRSGDGLGGSHATRPDPLP